MEQVDWAILECASKN